MNANTGPPGARITIGEQLAIQLPEQPPIRPLAWPCPHCGAQPGEPCVSSSGAVTPGSHAPRRRLGRYTP
jgi:hypothetical protein